MLLKKIKYYWWHLKKKGIVELSIQMLCDYYYNKKFSDYTFTPDSSMSLEVYQASDDVIDKSEGKDGYMNSPSSYYYIFKCFSFIGHKKNKVVFLDLGCGNGKLLVLGMASHFAKVYGVDLDSKSLIMATQNCKRAVQKFGGSDYEIINEDAASYNIPRGVNTIFMYNPFGENTMKRVIANIENSYNHHKRQIYILYYSPQFAKLFDEKLVFNKILESKLKNGRRDLIVYCTE